MSKLSTLPCVVPRYPPVITPMKLIGKAIIKLKTTGKQSRIPNAFIAYRMAVCQEIRSGKHSRITQPQLSIIVKQGWANEPEYVRKEYQQIATDARNLYKQIRYEFILFHSESNDELKKFNSESLDFDMIPNSLMDTIGKIEPISFDRHDNTEDYVRNSIEPSLYPPEKFNMVSYPTYTNESSISPLLSFEKNCPETPSLSNYSEQHDYTTSSYTFSDLPNSFFPSNYNIRNRCDECESIIPILHNRIGELEKLVNYYTARLEVNSQKKEKFLL
ncbi:hypothetical protein G9A89_004501 [Geosiphon pyriformis]|nr:hypothetical protein G9A89_004501 [Geosiphon pyriformis]